MRALVFVPLVLASPQLIGCAGSSAPITALQGTVTQALDSEPLIPVVEGEEVTGIPEGTQVGILWRNGCNGCGTLGNASPEERAIVSFQPIEVLGSFPDDFTMVLDEAPPTELVELNANYTTGVLVLAREDALPTFRRDVAFTEIGFTMPLLFEEEAAEMGILSMTPLYVGYVSGDDWATDINIDEDVNSITPDGVRYGEDSPILTAGYHVSRQSGVALIAEAQHFACQQTLQAELDASCEGLAGVERAPCEAPLIIERCGAFPDVYQNPDVLSQNDSVSVTIGGDEDLLKALAGHTKEDFVSVDEDDEE